MLLQQQLSPWHGLLLGLVQGPTELLPISSSAHTTLIPRLAGWREQDLGPQARNALEVALHAGAGAALLVSQRHELSEAARELNGRSLAFYLPALVPPAAVGYALKRRLERRAASSSAIAIGLALGGIAMALADASGGSRRVQDAGPWDGTVLGISQAIALLPGFSRNGMTLMAARASGFDRDAAQRLSWRVGLPVIAGAAGLEALLAVGGGLRDQRSSSAGSAESAGSERVAIAAGAAAAAASTLASSALLRPGRRDRALAPFALYRCGLAALAVCRRSVLS